MLLFFSLLCLRPKFTPYETFPLVKVVPSSEHVPDPRLEPSSFLITNEPLAFCVPPFLVAIAINLSLSPKEAFAAGMLESSAAASTLITSFTSVFTFAAEISFKASNVCFVPEIDLLEVIEVIPCTQKAYESIVGVEAYNG